LSAHPQRKIPLARKIKALARSASCCVGAVWCVQSFVVAGQAPVLPLCVPCACRCLCCRRDMLTPTPLFVLVARFSCTLHVSCCNLHVLACHLDVFFVPVFWTFRVGIICAGMCQEQGVTMCIPPFAAGVHGCGWVCVVCCCTCTNYACLAGPAQHQQALQQRTPHSPCVSSTAPRMAALVRVLAGLC
jgi:hypothetical protein